MGNKSRSQAIGSGSAVKKRWPAHVWRQACEYRRSDKKKPACAGFSC